jgi:thymidylate synthase (FAD)
MLGDLTLTTPTPVLDKGFVRLVDSMGSDISVVRAARVSYDAAWRAGENEGSDRRLIDYLWKNQHTSPFEAVQFTFEIRAPIFVLRQWHRHRTWSYNELSARYRELPDEYYVPDPRHIGVQSSDNKQVRIIDGTSEDAATVAAIDEQCRQAFATYRSLLARGVPREVARTVVPLGAFSHMFASVNLLNLLKFLTLRDDPHAQYEIRLYAQALRELVRPIVPVCIEVWEKYRRS